MFSWSNILEQKLFTGRLSRFLDKKNYFENKKCQDFDKSASNGLTRYQKILWRGLLGCKNLSKLTCLTMKFHSSHHATVHYFIHYFIMSKLSEKNELTTRSIWPRSTSQNNALKSHFNEKGKVKHTFACHYT